MWYGQGRFIKLFINCGRQEDHGAMDYITLHYIWCFVCILFLCDCVLHGGSWIRWSLQNTTSVLPPTRTTNKVLRYEAGRDDRVSYISSFAYGGCKPCCTSVSVEVFGGEPSILRGMASEQEDRKVEHESQNWCGGRFCLLLKLCRRLWWWGVVQWMGVV